MVATSRRRQAGLTSSNNKVFMHKDTLDVELVDMMDLLNETFSNRFIEKWKFKFSERFLKHFQLKLLDSVSNSKQLKVTTLYSFLVKKHGYSDSQVREFFNSIEIDLFQPIITGELKNPCS